MALTAYITATPLDSGKFKDIYTSIREFKSRFKERFELDHYMGGVVDDTNRQCEGYHKKLTMNGGEYNATNIPTTIPPCPTGGIVFFSIGGELCCYDGNTAYQMTEGGYVSIENGNIITTGAAFSRYGKPVYGNGYYAMMDDLSAGEYGSFIYSTDAKNWYEYEPGYYGGDLGATVLCVSNTFYTFSAGNTVTTTNFTSYTKASNNIPNGRGIASEYAFSKFFVGSYKTVGGVTYGTILSSSNGTTFSEVLAVESNSIQSIKFLNNKLFANFYKAAGSNYVSAIYESTDGATWTLAASFTTANSWRAVLEYFSGNYIVSYAGRTTDFVNFTSMVIPYKTYDSESTSEIFGDVATDGTNLYGIASAGNGATIYVFNSSFNLTKSLMPVNFRGGRTAYINGKILYCESSRNRFLDLKAYEYTKLE
jgi:hypothetical protein